MKKITFLIIVLFLGSSLLVSQDLVEVAKKEKERRAQLKKKSTVVVTNANLYETRRQATIRTAQPEYQTQDVQRATPQTTQRTTPAKPTPQQKMQPSQQIENIDQMDLSTDKIEQLDQLDPRGFRSDYATQVLNSNEFVKNPGLALDRPDGRFAELSLLGILDLEISTVNGPGNDIAIYARQTGAEEMKPGGKEEEGMPVVALSFGYRQGFWYGVLGMEEQGDWVTIGQGTGLNSPEKFDLGSLPSVKKIRIMFKPHSNADQGIRYYRGPSSESIIAVDAVETLHK